MEPLPQTAPLELWSVTTLIRDALGEGRGLVKWKVNLTAETAVDQHRAVSAMLERGDRAGAISYLSGASDRYARQAADRGTRTHAALEALTLGLEPLLDPEIEPFVRQYERWLDRWQPEFVMVEAPVYNVERGYAGTTDGVMKLGGFRLSYDYKTTNHPPEKESRPPFGDVALQLCAYSRCTEVGVLSEQRYSGRRRYYLYDPTAQHEPMPEVSQEWALAIVISPYDCRAVPTRIDDQVWSAFLHAQQVATFQTEVSRELFKPPFEAPQEKEEA